MCTLLVFPWIFSYKKKDCILFCCFLPLVSSAAASVATNRKELHADSSNILPCSATLLLWPGQTSRVFFFKVCSPTWEQNTPHKKPTVAHLSTFFLFQNTGTTTLTRTPTRWSLRTSRRPTSQSCRACRLSTRPATPSDTTQKAWSIQIWGHIHMCCSSQWVLLWARRDVLVVCSVLFYGKHSLICWFLMFIFRLWLHLCTR